MHVYQVIDWDSMESDYYVAGTYRSQDAADAEALRLNTAAHKFWMANCSPEGAKNYQDHAHVKAVEVKE